MMFYSKILGNRIKELRGKTPQDVCARELGISRGAMSYYENGTRNPDADVISRMCEYFHVSADYLLGLSNIKSPEPNVAVACEVTGLSEEAIKYIQYFVLKGKSNGKKIPNEFLSEIFIAPEFDRILHCFYEYITTFYNSYFNENGKEQIVTNITALNEFLDLQFKYVDEIKNFVIFPVDTTEYRNVIRCKILDLSKAMLEDQDLLYKFGMLNGERLMEKNNHEEDELQEVNPNAQHHKTEE